MTEKLGVFHREKERDGKLHNDEIGGSLENRRGPE